MIESRKGVFIVSHQFCCIPRRNKVTNETPAMCAGVWCMAPYGVVPLIPEAGLLAPLINKSFKRVNAVANVLSMTT